MRVAKFRRPGTEPLCREFAAFIARFARRTPSGAVALDHVLAVVPTAEAGRRLRIALVRVFGALVPPRICSPRQFFAQSPGRGGLPAASGDEMRAVAAKIVLDAGQGEWPALFPRLEAMRGASGGGRAAPDAFERALGAATPLVRAFDALADAALSPADVLAHLQNPAPGEAAAPPGEIERWRDVAALYGKVEGAVRGEGFATPLDGVRRAIAEGPELPQGVERIAIPAPLDAPQAFYDCLEAVPDSVETDIVLPPPPQGFAEEDAWDQWGRVRFAADSPWMKPGAVALPLRDEDIRRVPDARAQAESACAAFFGFGGPQSAAFGMLDSGLLPELEAAFLSRGARVRDPAMRPLGETALGAAARCATTMMRPDPSASEGAAFLRQSDVRAAIDAAGIDATMALAALDECLERHVPRRWSELAAFAARDAAHGGGGASGAGVLAAALAEADRMREPPHGAARGGADHLFAILARVFKGKTLSGDDPLDRAFASAAEAVRAAAQSVQSPLAAAFLSEAERAVLLRDLVRGAGYAADEDPGAVPMLGWLEAPWCDEPKLVLAGFDEKCVPSAPPDDAFLPDALRRELGLQCADSRYARDFALFFGMLGSRRPGDVLVFTERNTARGEARAPSRLLANCADAALPARVATLYGEPPARPRGLPGAVPKAWLLRLPVPPPPGVGLPPKVSVSRFKTYLASPLRYFLEDALGDPQATGKAPAEIPANAFGTLCHAALEDFGRDASVRRSGDEDAIAEFLKRRIDERFDAEWKAAPDSALAVAMRLQRDAAHARMEFFASIQASLVRDGWRIVEVEKRFESEIGGCRVTGIADRIDENETTGLVRVIDYKTWSRADPDSHRAFAAKPPPGLGAAPQQRLSFPNPSKKTGVLWWKDLQLPAYSIMCGAQSAAYLVLGDSAADSGFVGAVPGARDEAAGPAAFSAEALDSAAATMREVCARMAAGIFAEPGDLGDDWDEFIFAKSPDRSIDPAWLSDQAARLAAYEKAAGGAEP